MVGVGTALLCQDNEGTLPPRYRSNNSTINL